MIMALHDSPVSQSDVDDVINDAHEQIDNGGSRWPGMSYEQGLVAGLQWVTGETDDHPYEDE
ncbi:hypothetical protein PBI_SMARTIES_73 [Microbacterium phage Smarties]|uniref:Uncharacterized protein n=1 Tax=Microbacterium phage Ariadne TaxID=2656546 RepID=A0A649VAX6_9CAUD|nr:hypothetical protein QDA10_gp073 [Microbacterium phage Ariadne]QGJ89476.1 hypothetical protein PBI_ARIADNE_73 [Microbacterium phage Ariadne]QGJ91463.1 hypothetical protein PBI_SMARTIES_73 [Microbacterium phage Smarties]